MKSLTLTELKDDEIYMMVGNLANTPIKWIIKILDAVKGITSGGICVQGVDSPHVYPYYSARVSVGSNFSNFKSVTFTEASEEEKLLLTLSIQKRSIVSLSELRQASLVSLSPIINNEYSIV